MALSWNEIKERALEFSNEWIDETRERAEKDTFWNGFFNVFGISRRRVASFEEPVKKLDNKQGFTNESARIEFLFDLYNEYVEPMFNEKKKK